MISPTCEAVRKSLNRMIPPSVFTSDDDPVEGRAPRVRCGTRISRMQRLCQWTAGTVCTAWAGAVSCEAEAVEQPNIIAIMVDDIGVGDFGFSGGLDIPTPHIDQLAAEGVVFVNAYAAPACAPSRVALMTGCYPTRFGIEDNRPLDGPLGGLDVNQLTLGDYLRDAGYHTRLIGKWHLGRGPDLEFTPNNRGFDEFFGFIGSGNHMRYFDPVISRNGELSTHTGYIADIFTQEAREFLQQPHERPFFLHLAYLDAHVPQAAKQEFLDRFSYMFPRRQMAAAIIANLDDQIGLLMETLKETGLDENTLIFFMSDNGAHPRELGTSNGPHRGLKFETLEGGIRIPFAIRWPGVIPSDGTFEPMVHVFDVFSTSLAAAGLDLPEVVDGVDLLPFITGQQEGVPHERIYAIFNDIREWRIPGRDTNLARSLRAVREGEFKLLIIGDSPPELYHMAQDPGEWRNLADRYPERVESLRRAYEDWYATMIPQVVPDDHPLYGRQRQ